MAQLLGDSLAGELSSDGVDSFPSYVDESDRLRFSPSQSMMDCSYSLSPIPNRTTSTPRLPICRVSFCDSPPALSVTASSSCPLNDLETGMLASTSLFEANTSSSSLSHNSSSSLRAVEDLAVSGLWVFGYGSLCWHQGFDFTEAITGHVKGFARRFWQGNDTHRGTKQQPGRVATLVEDKEDIVWGQSFQVKGDAALPYLNNRECELGGYKMALTTFYPRDQVVSPFRVLLYIATPTNKHWLGESPLPDIADQIISSSGNSGHNVEYLLRLAEYLRSQVPEAKDDHLFSLEALVKERIIEQKLCLKTLMGEILNRSRNEGAGAEMAENNPPMAAAVLSPQFSARVPSKKLRCVNI